MGNEHHVALRDGRCFLVVCGSQPVGSHWCRPRGALWLARGEVWHWHRLWVSGRFFDRFSAVGGIDGRPAAQAAAATDPEPPTPSEGGGTGCRRRDGSGLVLEPDAVESQTDHPCDNRSYGRWSCRLAGFFKGASIVRLNHVTTLARFQRAGGRRKGTITSARFLQHWLVSATAEPPFRVKLMISPRPGMAGPTGQARLRGQYGIVSRSEPNASTKGGCFIAKATATDSPQECPTTIAFGTFSRSSAFAKRSWAS